MQLLNSLSCMASKGAGDARHRAVSYTSVCEQADNSSTGLAGSEADSVPFEAIR